MKIFFIDRCPKDVPTNTKLVLNNRGGEEEGVSPLAAEIR